jgi:hypothetical protein
VLVACDEAGSLSAVECSVDPLRPAAADAPAELRIVSTRADLGQLGPEIEVAVRVSTPGFFGALPLAGAALEFRPRDDGMIAEPPFAVSDDSGNARSVITKVRDAPGGPSTGPVADSIVFDVIASYQQQEVAFSPLPVCWTAFREPSVSPTGP